LTLHRTVRLFLTSAVYGITRKNTAQPEATDDYREHVHCMLGT